MLSRAPEALVRSLRARHIQHLVVLALAIVAVESTRAPAASMGSWGRWPTSSDLPAATLRHPTLASHAERLGQSLDAGARIVVFGDQRALADGEWQAMTQLIAARESQHPHHLPLLGIIDTGDIVNDGAHSDQFHALADILAPLSAYPYLVGVGNHEVHNNASGRAREHLARFLGPSLDEDFTAQRMYYRQDVAGIRMLFLDTNDLVYGPQGEFTGVDGLSYRGRAQLRWLAGELADHRGTHVTIAVLHHPLISSSTKHRAQSQKLWSLRYHGRTIAQMLADADVDLVLTGHTHTYERFRITAPSGESFQMINVSGRPRASFLWFGKESRQARAISGREVEFLRRAGWRDLEGWSFEQLDAMLGSGANQWVQLHLPGQDEPTAQIEAEVFYLIDRGRTGAKPAPRFAID